MKKTVFTILVFSLVLVGCGRKVENAGVSGDNQASSTVVENKVGLANPASANCEAQGGKLEIKDKANGQYGICYFEDNRQCEEWALFRGECPKGGLKITGYENDAQIFCAITGGQVDMQKNICTTVKNEKCDIEAYYNGGCEKDSSTADWQIYPSKELGLEIKYPKELFLYDVSQSGIKNSLIISTEEVRWNSEGSFAPLISVSKNNNINNDAVATWRARDEKEIIGYGQKIIKTDIDKINIDGNECLKFNYTIKRSDAELDSYATDEIFNRTVVYIDKDKYVYTISWVNIDYVKTMKDLNVFKQITESLKFTN